MTETGYRAGRQVPSASRAPRLLAVLLCFGLASAGARADALRGAELPGIGDGTRREEVDPRVPPWRILARVQTETGARCTGFAVAPGVILTAAHCLWIPATARFIRAADIHVLTGYDRGGFRLHERVSRVIIAPEYDPRDGGRSAVRGEISRDRATLILERPVVAAADLLPVIRARPGMAAMLVGYQQDRAEIPYGDTSCRVLGVSAGLIAHDCEGTRGVSGAPLLVREAGGGWSIGGIAVRAAAGAGGLAVALMP